MSSPSLDSLPDPFVDLMSAPPHLETINNPRGAASKRRRPIAEVLHNQSTSRWHKTHTDACNVDVKSRDHRILPGLEPAAGEDETWPHWGKTKLSNQDHHFWSRFQDAREKLYALVSGPPAELSTITSASILCRRLQSDVGHVWAALRKLRTLDPEISATINNILHDDSKSPPAKRVRIQPSRYSGMVSSAAFNLSSSPSSHSAASLLNATPPARARRDILTSSPEGSAFLPESEGQSSSQKPETLTADFIYAFLRYALQWLPPQHEMPNDNNDEDRQQSTVDLNIATTPRNVKLKGPVEFTSIDDGGLYIGEIGCVAIVEMKRSLGQIIEGEAMLSEAWIAQIVGESLAIRLQDGAWAGPPETVFIIAPARHYVRLFQLEIPDDYLTEFKNEAMGVATLTKSLKVYHTALLDLSESQDRLEFLQNISRIIKVARDVAIP